MYILYLYFIFVCRNLFYCIFRHYVSQRQTTFQFIMYFLHVEYGNKALLTAEQTPKLTNRKLTKVFNKA